MATMPPLPAVRVFDAAARHLSFTKAAAELGMTQAGVSYQIGILEERLGGQLFLRKPRRIELSELGARLAPRVAKALALLREAFEDVQERAGATLAISTVPTLASQWLAANLGLFQIANPHIAVRIESQTQLIDFANEEFDVAIRSTAKLGQGLVGHVLSRAEFAPMLHPKLVEEHGIREPADLLKVPQITPDDPWVAEWFRQVGVPWEPPANLPFARLGHQSMEAVAVMAGRGVAMLTPQFYAEEIRTGRLVQPFSQVGWEGNYYYLVYPEARRNAAKIRAFRDWILEATADWRREDVG